MRELYKHVIIFVYSSVQLESTVFDNNIASAVRHFVKTNKPAQLYNVNFITRSIVFENIFFGGAQGQESCGIYRICRYVYKYHVDRSVEREN